LFSFTNLQRETAATNIQALGVGNTDTISDEVRMDLAEIQGLEIGS
jgi:hypothetical protein